MNPPPLTWTKAPSTSPSARRVSPRSSLPRRRHHLGSLRYLPGRHQRTRPWADAASLLPGPPRLRPVSEHLGPPHRLPSPGRRAGASGGRLDRHGPPRRQRSGDRDRPLAPPVLSAQIRAVKSMGAGFVPALSSLYAMQESLEGQFSARITLMPQNRPRIPAAIERQVLIEAGHRCAVCGAELPLERAHIIAWNRSKDHSAENLLCLCANCHSRADTEEWGETTLRQYKQRPWVIRARTQENATGDGGGMSLPHNKERNSEFAEDSRATGPKVAGQRPDRSKPPSTPTPTLEAVAVAEAHPALAAVKPTPTGVEAPVTLPQEQSDQKVQTRESSLELFLLSVVGTFIFSAVISLLQGVLELPTAPTLGNRFWFLVRWLIIGAIAFYAGRSISADHAKSADSLNESSFALQTLAHLGVFVFALSFFGFREPRIFEGFFPGKFSCVISAALVGGLIYSSSRAFASMQFFSRWLFWATAWSFAWRLSAYLLGLRASEFDTFTTAVLGVLFVSSWMFLVHLGITRLGWR